jgi:hypothetical protein
MDRRSAKKQKHKKATRKSSDVTVATDFSSASTFIAKFMDEDGVVTMKELPIKFAGKSAEQVALALLEDPTGPEAVVAITLSEKSKMEFTVRANGLFASNQVENERKPRHLKKVEGELELTKVESKRLHDEMACISAMLQATTQHAMHLHGMSEHFKAELVATQKLEVVHKAILELLKLVAPTHEDLPFQNKSLKAVASLLKITSWKDIAAQSYNVTIRAILVCSALGLSRNERFRAQWTELAKVIDDEKAVWFRLIGDEPEVRTGRDHGDEATKVRLAVYLGIQAPTGLMKRVLSNIAKGSDSVDSLSLSSVDQGKESDEGDGEGMPIPENIHVGGGGKCARDSGVSLEEVPDEQLQAQLKRIQEEMERRVAASASAGEDDNDA